MKLSQKAIVTATYGCWLAAAGVWRFVQAGSKPALGFGLVTAALALIGAMMFYRDRPKTAIAMIAITLVFVVGFFVTKSAKEGLDLRVAVTLAMSIAVGIVLLLPTRGQSPTEIQS